MSLKHSVIFAVLCGQMMLPATAFAQSYSQAAANKLAIQTAVAEINTITDAYTVTESNKTVKLNQPTDLNTVAELKIGSLTAPFGIKVNETKIDQVASLLDADWDLVEGSESEATLFMAGITLPIEGWRKTIFENLATDSTLVIWFDEQQIVQRMTYVNHTKQYFSKFSNILDQQIMNKGPNSAFGKDYHKSFFGIFDNQSTVELITRENSYHNDDLEILLHSYKAGLGMPNDQFLAANKVNYQTINDSADDYYLELGAEDYDTIVWAEEPYEGQSLTLVSKEYLNIFKQILCQKAQQPETTYESKNKILAALENSCNLTQ